MAHCLNISKLKSPIRFLRCYNKIVGANLHKQCSSDCFRLPRLRNVNFSNCVALKVPVNLSWKSQIKRQDQDNGLAFESRKAPSFFDEIQDLILILSRIALVWFVLVALLIAQIATRLTGSSAFPEIFLKAIEFLGPTFIKLGQWASTRKDLFPEDICRVLSKLQRASSVHSWMYTKRLFDATYGPAWRNLFVKLEENAPIGSGCCAQVYKAWIDVDARVETIEEPKVPRTVKIVEYLCMGGIATFLGRVFDGNDSRHDIEARGKNLQPVAVKVMHPGIKGQFKRDLIIIRGLCKCATYVIPQLHWLNLTECVDEFSRIIENQVDLRTEARNLIKFSENFSKKQDVIFPRPYLNFTHRDILVEQFLEGAPISDYLDSLDRDLQRRLAKIGIKTILQMVFRDNFIHCDLHPGNILVEINEEPGKEGRAFMWKFIKPFHSMYKLRLIVLDCGLVVSLNERCWQNLRDVFRSIVMGNGELAAEYILRHSSHMTPDPEGFKSTMSDIVATYIGSGTNAQNVNVSTVVGELFAAMVRHRVKQDGSFSSVILGMMVIEGLGRSLDPNIDIFAEVLPFLLPGLARVKGLKNKSL